MPTGVRIARLTGDRLRPAAPGGGDPLAEHAALVELIRRHLPGVTGSLLASPRRVGDGAETEWYSDLAGQPVALNSLPASEQEPVRRLLADRVASVRQLAERLPQLEPASAHFAEALRLALTYPGDDHVYVIGGQPVLTYWGHVDPTRPSPQLNPVVSGGKRSFWLWPAMAVGITALAALLYWWLQMHEVSVPAIVSPPLPDFQAMLADASGDCEKLEALSERLARAQVAADVDLTPVRTALDREIRTCLRPDYREMLAAALGDCEALEALREQLQLPAFPEAPELPAVRNELNAALGACRMEVLRQEYAAVKNDCRELKAFGSRLRAADTGLDGYQQLKADMAAKLGECNKPKVDPADLCPGERSKELAPELVLVFDASGSMKYPLVRDEELQRRVLQKSPLAVLNPMLVEQAIQQQFGSMEKRVDVAKRATRRLVSELPDDVDVGLVLVRNCPKAQKVGFFAPSQRQKLLRDINAIAPYRKTPLASGIQVAGGMLDGVNKPSLMVVISDGKETCGANPCSMAQQLAKRKPRLKINVVDILGTGAGNCVAKATGGRVWTANNASDLSSMLERAASDVQGPAHCRR